MSKPKFPLHSFICRVKSDQEIADEMGCSLSQFMGKTWFCADVLLPSMELCESCGQHMQCYKRTIKFRQVRELGALYKRTAATGQPYHHIRTFKHTNDGELAKLTLHNLVVMKRNPDGSECRGNWGITKFGIDFLKNGLQVPESAGDYLHTHICYFGPAVGVMECWNKKFDYDEMLGLDLDTLMYREKRKYYETEEDDE